MGGGRVSDGDGRVSNGGREVSRVSNGCGG